ncbi:MAG: MFS transporter, partial [Hyphomicrobiaceae bacterium]
AWVVLRVVNGVCFAGLFMSIESWLTSTAEANTRGRILAVYTLINLTVVTLGMQMIALAPVSGFQLFSIVAVLYSLAAVPIALTGAIAPNPPVAARLQLGHLLSVSPAAVVGCLCAGFANAAFWSLAPLYGKAAGLTIVETATMLTFAVLAGALAQWPVGVLSDRIGRRVPLIATSLGAAFAGIALFAFAGAGVVVVMTLAALYGSCSFLIYTMSVAHANDLVPRERAVEVSSGLLLTFSGAAVIGPLVAAFVMARLGAGALFLYTAAVHGAVALVLLVRLMQRPELPVDESESFVYVPRTTPAVFGLDPRTEPAADQLEDQPADMPSSADDDPVPRTGSGSIG